MPGKQSLLVGNWKMHFVTAEAAALCTRLAAKSEGLRQTSLGVTPSFTSLSICHQALKNSKIKLGAQNVHWEKQGAFTGEISAEMLLDAGCQYALCGHSERRHIFLEKDEISARRALSAMAAGLHVIFCIGETLQEREDSLTHKVIERQLSPLLAEIKPESISSLVIAYEPVWAIGTGKVAGLDEIDDAHNSVETIWNKALGKNCPQILYGGSVTPDNYQGIIARPKVSGALVGGASLSYEKFSALIDIAEAA